jgi:hypothetical protein
MTILRDLPYFDARTVVVVRNREEPIKPAVERQASLSRRPSRPPR